MVTAPATFGVECACGDINPPGAKLCDGCDRPLGNVCVGCGSPLPVGTAGRPRKYCTNKCRSGREAPWATWTSAATVEAVRAWHRKHGDIPTAWDWRRSGVGHPDASVVRHRFGTWNDLIRAAGFTPRPAHRPALRDWTRRNVRDAFTVWMFRHRELPKFADWQSETDEHPSARQVIRLFGSWNAGIVYAGYQPLRMIRSEDEYRKQAAA
jgi:hypothetical protein